MGEEFLTCICYCTDCCSHVFGYVHCTRGSLKMGTEHLSFKEYPLKVMKWSVHAASSYYLTGNCTLRYQNIERRVPKSENNA